MRLQTVFAALGGGLTFVVILPWLAILISDRLGLPVYKNPIAMAVGMIFCLAWAAIFLYCSGLFMLFGKGTPAPIEPPKKLVIKGLYNYTRNPMYIGYFLVLFGEFLIFGRPLLLPYSLGFLLCIHLYVVYVEEPVLGKRFGKSYMEYAKKVPRWL